MFKPFCAGGIAAAVMLATPAGAAVLAGSGFAGSSAIQYGVSVSVTANDVAADQVAKSDSVSNQRTAEASGNLSASAARFVLDGSGDGPSARANVGSDLKLTFASAAAAALTFTTEQFARSTGADGVAQASTSYSLRYDFRTTEAATFELLYNFAGNMGCCGNRIELLDFSGSNSAAIGQTFFGTVAPGALTASLVAGGRYALQISRGTYLGNDAASVRGVGTDTKNLTDRISFSITDVVDPVAAVPEPTSWAMMVLGFGVVGRTLRRRRRITAAVVTA